MNESNVITRVIKNRGGGRVQNQRQMQLRKNGHGDTVMAALKMENGGP